MPGVGNLSRLFEWNSDLSKTNATPCGIDTVGDRGMGMGISLRISARIRTALIVGLATSWPAWSVRAADRPALVPLDAAAVAEDARTAPPPVGRARLENRAKVIDAVYQSMDKVGVVQAGNQQPAEKIQRVGHEPAPTVEAHVQSKGTSSDKVKKTALAELPLDKLNQEQRARVQSLLDEVGYFRRLPTTVFAAEPDVYQFFVRYPDVAVSIWRVMGISEMKMWQTAANEYEGDSGDGSTGIIDVLYRSSEENLLICEGQYQSPLLKKPIKARSLVLLKTSFFKETDGTMYVTHRADMFVAFPSQTVENVAKVLSPVTGTMADRTFTEMSLFLRMMSLAMTRRPNWVDQIAGQMEGVPAVRRQQLRQVTALVHNAERKRQGLPPVATKTASATGAPAALPKDLTSTAVPVSDLESGPKAASASVDAKPATIKLDQESDSDGGKPPKPIEELEKKTDGSPSKPNPEPGFEFIPKKK